VSGGRPAPARVAGVLFDLDGVLVDSFGAWHAVLDQALAERGRAPIPLSEMRAGWGQGIQADAERYFPGETIAELAATYDRLFRGHLERVVLMPEALSTVAALAARGTRLALVTNTPRDVAQRILDLTGLGPHFAALAAGDDVPRPKPDPALLHLAGRRLGLGLESCVFVGDTAVDLEAGRRAGCFTIGFRLDADARIESLSALVPFLDGRLSGAGANR
jgi:HAD superfamily hydrolase (TIGR01509 family)